MCWDIVRSQDLFYFIHIIDNPPDYGFIKSKLTGVIIDEINY
jgi:hypothetical protein